MIYCFDLDGTICTLTHNSSYEKAIPYATIVAQINDLHDQGHTIKIFTARGCQSGIDYYEFTRKQLVNWGVKFHELIMNKKPHYDLYVGDKCVNVVEWSKWNNLNFKKKKVGFVASSFDLMHPGYILMFKDAKTVCDHLICALHENPKSESMFKNTMVHTLDERKMILESIKYVDQIVTYKTEDELYDLIKQLKPDIRILGTDYKYKTERITGLDLPIEIHWHKRDHAYSTSALREKVSTQWIEDES